MAEAEETFDLRVTRTQLILLRDLAELGTRVHMGHWECVAWEAQRIPTHRPEETRKAADLLRVLGLDAMGHPCGGGFWSPNQEEMGERAHLTFDLAQVLRYEVYRLDPAPAGVLPPVDSYPPTQRSRHPLPEVRRVDPEPTCQECGTVIAGVMTATGTGFRHTYADECGERRDSP